METYRGTTLVEDFSISQEADIFKDMRVFVAMALSVAFLKEEYGHRTNREEKRDKNFGKESLEIAVLYHFRIYRGIRTSSSLFPVTLVIHPFSGRNPDGRREEECDEE